MAASMQSTGACTTASGSRSRSGVPSSKHSTTSSPRAFSRRAFPGELPGGSLSPSSAMGWTPRQRCFALSTNSASTLSTGVICTTPGGSSLERRPTVGTLKPLLSGLRSGKRFGAGSPNTAPKRRLESGGTLWRTAKGQGDDRLSLDLVRRPSVSSSLRFEKLAAPSAGSGSAPPVSSLAFQHFHGRTPLPEPNVFGASGRKM